MRCVRIPEAMGVPMSIADLLFIHAARKEQRESDDNDRDSSLQRSQFEDSLRVTFVNIFRRQSWATLLTVGGRNMSQWARYINAATKDHRKAASGTNESA